MLLYQIAGLSSAPPAELGAQEVEILEALIEAKASQAIAAGVRLDLEQWAELDELERRCWSPIVDCRSFAGLSFSLRRGTSCEPLNCMLRSTAARFTTTS